MIDEKKFMEFMTALEDAGAEHVSFDNLRKFVDEFPKIGGWILCSERLPEEKINPVTKDFYEYQVTFQSEDVTDVRHYKFGNGHWWNGPGIMDEYITAWREPLEAYHGQMD